MAYWKSLERQNRAPSFTPTAPSPPLPSDSPVPPDVTLRPSEYQQQVTTLPSLGEAVAAVRRVRLTPWVTPNGVQAQMVLIDWANMGSSPIRAAYAEITAYDANGRVLDSSVEDYCIYAVDGRSRGILPGETYLEPEGNGFVLISTDMTAAPPVRVEARITRAKPTSSL
jgi:hypothetical protein